jgi:hypothetical protein
MFKIGDRVSFEIDQRNREKRWEGKVRGVGEVRRFTDTTPSLVEVDIGHGTIKYFAEKQLRKEKR